MTNPADLLNQARTLTGKSPYDPVPDIDVRRAMSNAYYAMFHTVAVEIANRLLAGNSNQSQRSALYLLAYRTINHRQLAEKCALLTKTAWPNKYKEFQATLPNNQFDNTIKDFLSFIPKLQLLRHEADYNPRFQVDLGAAITYIDDAERLIDGFRKQAPPDQRHLLCLLLLLEPRG